MSRRLSAVLFDWDGTLVDSAEPSFRCYQRMFAAFDIPFDRDTYARTYSPNWHHTFRCLGLPEDRWAEADARWLAAFAEETVALMPGAVDALQLLSASGLGAAIVTSGGRERVSREMTHLGVAHYFRASVFGSDVVQRKPHPEALHLCLSQLGLSPSATAYVGDSPEDIEMARAAGVLAVAVPGGYPNREALLGAGADLVVGDVCEAVRMLRAQFTVNS